MVSLLNWLLWFGVASAGLRQSVGEFGDWTANGLQLYAVYRTLTAGRLIGLDKCPGVRPVVVEETWRRMLEKCVLAVTRAEAKEACWMDQLCGGLEVRIEGGIYAVRLLWKNHAQ